MLDDIGHSTQQASVDFALATMIEDPDDAAHVQRCTFSKVRSDPGAKFADSIFQNPRKLLGAPNLFQQGHALAGTFSEHLIDP